MALSIARLRLSPAKCAEQLLRFAVWSMSVAIVGERERARNDVRSGGSSYPDGGTLRRRRACACRVALLPWIRRSTVDAIPVRLSRCRTTSEIGAARSVTDVVGGVRKSKGEEAFARYLRSDPFLLLASRRRTTYKAYRIRE